MFIAPYDDPYTIAGQGTVGQEILRQVPFLFDWALPAQRNLFSHKVG